MFVTRVLMLFVVSLTVTTVLCQTFQYSHGWTNGKRSMSSALDELVNSAGQSDNVLVNCELQKLKLLLQGNVNNQFLQIPCEYYDTPKRNIPEIMTSDHFRRQPTSANNNY